MELRDDVRINSFRCIDAYTLVRTRVFSLEKLKDGGRGAGERANLEDYSGSLYVA